MDVYKYGCMLLLLTGTVLVSPYFVTFASRAVRERSCPPVIMSVARSTEVLALRRHKVHTYLTVCMYVHTQTYHMICPMPEPEERDDGQTHWRKSGVRESKRNLKTPVMTRTTHPAHPARIGICFVSVKLHFWPAKDALLLL
jgi:hypothetical protein